MPSTIKSLKLISDPTRLRILMLLHDDALSVAELQEILGMGQSRISTQLSQLKTAGLVSDARSGKNNMYSATLPTELAEITLRAASEIPEVPSDELALRHILRKRQGHRTLLFRRTRGTFRGKTTCPAVLGKHWPRRLSNPSITVALPTLGAGEGTLSQLLAQRCGESDRHRPFPKNGGIRTKTSRSVMDSQIWNSVSAISRSHPSMKNPSTSPS